MRPGLGIFVVCLSLSEAAVRFLNGLLSCGLVCFCRGYGGDIGRCGGISMVVDLLRYLLLREQQVIAGDVILSLYIFRLRFQNAGVGGGGLLFCCLDRCFRILDIRGRGFQLA